MVLDAVTALYKLGFVSGSDGNFRPNDFITRAEYAQMVSFVDQLQPSSVTKFTDIYGHWAETLINAATQKSWISGYADGTDYTVRANNDSAGFTKTGYRFLGWADTADANTANYGGRTIALNEQNLAYYAVWAIDFRNLVSYSGSGASFTVTQTDYNVNIEICVF